MAHSMENNKRSQASSLKIWVWILVLFLLDYRTLGRSVNLSFLKMWVKWTEKHYAYSRDYGSYKDVYCQERKTELLSTSLSTPKTLFLLLTCTHCVIIKSHVSFTESVLRAACPQLLSVLVARDDFLPVRLSHWTPKHELGATQHVLCNFRSRHCAIMQHWHTSIRKLKGGQVTKKKEWRD